MTRVAEISVFQVQEKLQKKEGFLFLDVRTPDEYQAVHLKAYHIPLSDLERRYQELDPQKEIIVYCHHGMRSARAGEFLLGKGFKNIKNMTGGIDQWACDIDQNLKRY